MMWTCTPARSASQTTSCTAEASQRSGLESPSAVMRAFSESSIRASRAWIRLSSSAWTEATAPSSAATLMDSKRGPFSVRRPEAA